MGWGECPVLSHIHSKCLIKVSCSKQLQWPPQAPPTEASSLVSVPWHKKPWRQTSINAMGPQSPYTLPEAGHNSYCSHSPPTRMPLPFFSPLGRDGSFSPQAHSLLSRDKLGVMKVRTSRERNHSISTGHHTMQQTARRTRLGPWSVRTPGSLNLRLPLTSQSSLGNHHIC